MPEAPSPLSFFRPHQRFANGDYQLVQMLGVGGASEVWEAIEVYSGNRVAIKVLHDTNDALARRFAHEHKFYTELRHPNIVRMLRAGVTGPSEGAMMFLVMDRLYGITLRKALARAARIELFQALHAALQLADTMAYVHKRGIWHRDLKPENLLIDTQEGQKGHLWLFDFGIAKFADAAKDKSLKDTSGLPDVATAKYMSPEQVNDRRAVSARSDIYAFGIVLYEMLTGEHPFVQKSAPMPAGVIMHAHLTMDLPPIQSFWPDLPPLAQRVIERCSARDPAGRYASFEEVKEALKRLVRATLPPSNALGQSLDEEALRMGRARAFEGSSVLAEPRAAAPPPPKLGPTTVPMAAYPNTASAQPQKLGPKTVPMTAHPGAAPPDRLPAGGSVTAPVPAGFVAGVVMPFKKDPASGG